MRSKVYSYIRFSTPEQAKGHSLERQLSYAKKYAQEKGLTLDETLTLKDEGLSAYHQKHIKKGALGVFCKAIEDGYVAAGSVLIIENLDRLNRGKVRFAMPFLLNIVNSGIIVITASDGREYSESSLDENNYQLYESLSIMSRAYDESETKSKRVKAAIVYQIEQWIKNGSGKIIRNGADPYWCKPREDKSGFDLVPERVEIIKHIIDLYQEGWGYNKIVTYLNENFKPFKGEKWYVMYITTFIKNRTLIGERKFTVNNETYVIKNYYQPIMTESEFYKLQKIIASRASTKSQRKYPSIITGMKIGYCGMCGDVLCAQNYAFKEKNGKLSDGFRRIRCGSSAKGSSCKNTKSISIAPIERTILEYCADQMELSSVLGDNDKTSELKARIASLHQQIEKTELAIKTGEQSIVDLLSQGEGVSVVTNIVEKFKVEHEQLQQQISKLEDELRYEGSSKAIDLVKEWQEIKTDVYNLDENARLMIRQLVNRTFKRMDIFLHGMALSDNPVHKLIKQSLATADNTIDIIMTFHNGKTRLVSIDKASGSWVKGSDIVFNEALESKSLADAQTAARTEPA